jgi:protein CpxP
MSRLSMSRVATVLAAVALPILALSAGASAQTTPAASSMSTAPVVAAPSPNAASALPKPMSQKVEQHIKQLHDQLGITAAQKPQWEQYAQVVRENAARMEPLFAARRAGVATMDAPDNMRSYAQLAQMHANNMERLATAFQSLYDTFSGQQKMAADSVFRSAYRNPAGSKIGAHKLAP